MLVYQIISGDLWAGAEVMYFNLLKGLQKYKDLQITSILLNDGKLAHEIRKIGIPVIVVDESKLNSVQILRYIQDIVIQTSPDLIHSHRLKENILAHMAVKNSRNRIPLVSTQHGMPEPFSKLKVLKQYILLKYNYFVISKYYEYVVAVSEDIRQNLGNKYGIPQEKIWMIRNGIDISNNHLSEKKCNEFIIGSAGRFFPIKNYTFMVEIAREVLKRNNKIRFELAGDGPEKKKIQELIRKYELEKAFVIRGFLDDMEAYYQRLNIYLNTSLHEGIPMSVLEAMAQGIPIVAPNTGGLKEIIANEFQGCLVDGRNPVAFADKCLQLYNDIDLRQKIAAASKNRVNTEFSIYKMADSYYGLYKRILKQ